MKRKINFCLLILILISISSFAQKNKKSNPLTKEQQYRDSIEFLKFKEKNPAAFLNKRLPIKLVDNSYVVNGFSTGIRIQNNHICDSVYHNFHPGMPDTSTVNPFNDIQVTDATIKIDLFFHLFMAGGKNDSALINPVDSNLIVDNKIGKLPVGNFDLNQEAIRLSINGKLLFEWKTLSVFAKQVFKAAEYFKPSPNYVRYGVSAIYGYMYGYNICDTSLNLNDQLLIEIKNTRNDWMIDRYNITRVAVAPEISYITPTDNQGRERSEIIKTTSDKIFVLNAGEGIINVYLKKNLSFADSDIVYHLQKDHSDMNFTASGSMMSSFPFNFEANTHYTLSLYYKFQPETNNTYSIIVKPYWWQNLWIQIVALVIGISVIFLMIFKVYRYINNKKLVKQKEATEMSLVALKAIRSQLNPHFIFNALSSIQGLINSNQIAEANYYLTHFSNLMRSTLVENNEIYHPLEKEIEVLETYIKIEQLRFPFQYKIIVASEIKANEIEIPCLILQPLVENAIKHGISSLQQKGEINIHFYLKDKGLVFEIIDNGAGFNYENTKDGFGYKLTNDRINLLNKMAKEENIEKKVFRLNNETVVQMIFKNSI